MEMLKGNGCTISKEASASIRLADMNGTLRDGRGERSVGDGVETRESSWPSLTLHCRDVDNVYISSKRKAMSRCGDGIDEDETIDPKPSVL
jgi:hypothetical protein